MELDPDFKTFELKINAAGSWANAGRFPAEKLAEVKAHCIGLAKASHGCMKFKLVDPAGSVLGNLISGFSPEWLNERGAKDGRH